MSYRSYMTEIYLISRLRSNYFFSSKLVFLYRHSRCPGFKSGLGESHEVLILLPRDLAAQGDGLFFHTAQWIRGYV